MERERGFVDGERRHESRRDSRPPRLHARHGVLLRETQKPKENAAQVRAEKVRRESEETRRVRGIENQMMIRKREHHQSILLERASRRRRVGCVTLLPRLVRVPPRFVSCRFDERKTREYFARANTYVHVITLVLHSFFPLSIPKPHSIIELCCAQKTRLFFFFDLFFVSIFSTKSDKSLFYDDDVFFFVVVVYVVL